MAWGVILLEEVDTWFLGLAKEDPISAELVPRQSTSLPWKAPCWVDRSWIE
jgi:hypothetical protein